MTMTAAALREMAYRWCNWSAYDLIKAGVLVADSKGEPAVGGSDWERFNTDPWTFIIKLPDDRLEKLASLLTQT